MSSVLISNFFLNEEYTLLVNNYRNYNIEIDEYCYFSSNEL